MIDYDIYWDNLSITTQLEIMEMMGFESETDLFEATNWDILPIGTVII